MKFLLLVVSLYSMDVSKLAPKEQVKLLTIGDVLASGKNSTILHYHNNNRQL